MTVHINGAKSYWKKRVWVPSEFEEKCSELEAMVRLTKSYVRDEALENLRILELCCGQGHFTGKLLGELKSVKSYYCVDVSERSLELLSNRIALDNPGFLDKVELYCGYFGDDEELLASLPSDMDIVVCTRSLMHISNLVNFFMDVKGKLSDNGVFIGDIVPKSQRLKQWKDRYGLKAYPIEVIYRSANLLASSEVLSKYLSKVGILRSDFLEIDSICDAFKIAKLKVIHDEMDTQNYYYRFIVRPIS